MTEGKLKTVFLLNSGVRSPSFIATADVHLAKKLYNMPELEEDLKDNLVRLADTAIEKKVDYLVIAGDLFEDNHVKPHMIAFVKNIVAKLAKHNIKLVGIAGDHDKPLKEEAWVHIANIEPVTIEPTFAGIDYFDYSTVTVDELMKLITAGRDCDKVLWLFLHCQFPQVFDRGEPKKIIDFNKLKLFENFPNLQGIIAGDLHNAPETEAFGVGHKAYVGYPGSLGALDHTEYQHNKHVLYCDGKQLMHLPFGLKRPWRDIDFRGGPEADNFDVQPHLEWAAAQPMKPMIFVNYDSNSEDQISKVIVPLHPYALIKRRQLPIGATDLNEAPVVSCRSEATSDDKIEKSLRWCCEGNEELYELSASLLKDDPREVLDKLKEQYKL